MDFLADSCLSTSVMVKSYKKPCQTNTRYHFCWLVVIIHHHHYHQHFTISQHNFSDMTKKNEIKFLRYCLQNLFVSIDSGNDLKFIQNYEKYVDKLAKFMKKYRSYATKLDMFDAVQKKVEALINSPEISSLIKESLRSKFDHANELAVGFSEVNVSSFNYMSLFIIFLSQNREENWTRIMTV